LQTTGASCQTLALPFEFVALAPALAQTYID